MNEVRKILADNEKFGEVLFTLGVSISLLIIISMFIVWSAPPFLLRILVLSIIMMWVGAYIILISDENT